jgi:glycosyltransferase 2 family protein
VVAVLVAVAIAVALVGRAGPGDGRSRWARLRRAIAGDVRGALVARRAWPVIAFTSLLVVMGHAITFVIAARTAGATAPLSELVPLALLAMLAMVLPSVAGWGPREGATAWAFAAAGLGADLGVATAVVYGVMVLVASLPGALVLVAAWVPRPAIAETRGAADA